MYSNVVFALSKRASAVVVADLGRNAQQSSMLQLLDDYKWHALGIATACGVVWGIYNSRTACSKVCDLTKTNINKSIRKSFSQDFRMASSNVRDSNHSHPKSAQNRTDAEHSIDDFIVSNGFEPYSVSTSARDDVGQRLYYSAKDVDLPYVNMSVTNKHILRMIDVDYYADMEHWLWKGRPILLYSFVPESVGGEVIEGNFTIEDDTLRVIYNGGGVYQHKLWDYNVDHFIVKGKVWSLMVKVDQVKLPSDPQRRIILLTPTTWYLSIFNWLFGKPNILQRRKFSFGDANLCTFMNTTKDSTKMMISIGPRGAPACSNIEYKVFVGLCARLEQSKHPNMSDVEKYLRVGGAEDHAILAPIIYSAYIGGWYNVKYRRMDKLVDCGKAKAPHYQVCGPLITEDGKEIGVEIYKPIVTGAGVFPCLSYNNDYQAIKGRVDDVKNIVKPNNVFNQYLREFVRAFPEGTLCPISINEVITIQNKPRQKERSERAKHWVGHQPFYVQSFMKKETYPKVTDPRNISTCPTSHTLDLSRYTYSAKEYFKTLPWFCPCKTPREIVDAVQELVAGHNQVLSCDYSRLDGTISEFLRKVEKAVYLRMFKKPYQEELSKLLESELNCKAYTATGTKYNPGFSRLSGSPLTTDGNTLIVAFVLYCAARKSNLIKPGAISKIPGLVYGDDKLAVGLTTKDLEDTAKGLGLTLKCDISYRNTPVTFLSRVFVDPWTTTTTMQAPLRALGKMHLSCIRNVDQRIVARYKAEGYFVTDSKTPLISEWCIKVIKDTADITDVHLQQHANDLMREQLFWIREYGSEAAWPQDVVDRPAMETIVADQLGLTISELQQFIERFEDGEDWDPIEVELKVTVPAIITTNQGTQMSLPGTPDGSPVPYPIQKKKPKLKGATSTETV